jgi:hypothetical protein
MTPLSQLSPIDPEGTFIEEGRQQKFSVEDVTSFIEFAKDKVGIAESQPLSHVLDLLAKEIKPQILGSLNRTHARIRRLARKMLQLHLNDPKHETQLIEIVNNLTQLLYSHNHLINRREARDSIGFGEMIEYADERTEAAMQALYGAFVEALQLDKPFDPALLLNGAPESQITVRQAFIESREIAHVFETRILIKVEVPTQAINIVQLGTPAWSTSRVEETSNVLDK